MAYQTGTASTPTDLTDELATFAAANGWTLHTPAGGGYVFENGDCFVGMKGSSNSVDSRNCISNNNALAWNAQPGHSGVTHSCNVGAGPYTAYHFYAESEEGKPLLGCAVEIAAGLYRHIVLAELIKYGSWTGGGYSDSTFHDPTSIWTNVTTSTTHRYICDTIYTGSARGQFHCDNDGETDHFVKVAQNDAIASSVDYGTGSVRGDGKWAGVWGTGYQRWNLRTPLWPLELFVNRASSLRSIVGRIPAMRLVNLRNYVPGEILSIGGDDWQLWPVTSRTNTSGNSSSSTPSSAYYGHAYLRT